MILGLSLVFGAIGAYVGLDLLHMQVTKNAAFEEAKGLSGGKGIINVGAGPHRTFGAQVIAESPEVLANIDITPNGMSNLIRLDVEREPLPFADKQFGCAFASHLLEHLDNWQFCLSEASRVADYVVIVLPDPRYFIGWIVPEHKQHFSIDEISEIAELYPNMVVYY